MIDMIQIFILMIKRNKIGRYLTQMLTFSIHLTNLILEKIDLAKLSISLMMDSVEI